MIHAEPTPGLSIYIANHGRTDRGIQEYLSILRGLGTRHGYRVETSDTLNSEAVNIIIDEFTNRSTNQAVSHFKREYPDGCCVFIVTEFVERRYLVRSMNNFGGVVDAALLALINVWLRFRRSDFLKARIGDWALALVYLPVVSGFAASVAVSYVVIGATGVERASHLRERVRRYIGSLAYFHKRYLGLERHIRHADRFVASHECIEPGLVAAGWLEPRDKRYLGVLYPELDEAAVLEKLSEERSNCIEITGNVTPYRQRCIDRINAMIAADRNSHGIDCARARPFDSCSVGNGEIRAAGSLHPPQTENWRYSSPMRLFRALQVDGTVPIITQYFGQNPMEDVCLRFESIEALHPIARVCADRKLRVETLEPGIARYNDTVRTRNDAIMGALRGVTRSARGTGARSTPPGRLRVLLLLGEHDRWAGARNVSYHCHLGLEEALRTHGVEVTTLLNPFVPQAPRLLRGRRFDQIWAEVVVNPMLTDEVCDWMSEAAPVRLGLCAESTALSEQELEVKPEFATMLVLLRKRARCLTHLALGDEADPDRWAKQGLQTAWWLVSANRRLISETPPPLKFRALFSGHVYGDRGRWLSHPALEGLLDNDLHSEGHAFMLAFDLWQLFWRGVHRYGGLRPGLMPDLYLRGARRFRCRAASAWQRHLRESSAVVSLPHMFKSYPGRIAEAMAASRPAVSWEVPGRPRVREVFEPRREILLYREPEELREHILKLEREPGLGPTIARRARARLLARHTTEMRVGQLLRWMESGEPPDYFQ